jgi:hypothetical protein
MAVVTPSYEPLERKARFAASGYVIRNTNGDGTSASPQRLLGARENLNLNVSRSGMSILDGSGKAYLLVRRDSTDELKMVDFSGALNLSAVTPSEVVIALNAAGFTDMEAIIDNATGRPNLRCTNPDIRYTQVFGYLAGALGFGGGKAFRSMGSFFYDGLTRDDVITIARTDQRSDDTNVDQQGGGKGTLTRIVVKGKRIGAQYALNIKQDDNLLMQIVEGGELIAGIDGIPTQYNTPLPDDDVGERGIELYKFIPLYLDGTQSGISQETDVKVEHCFYGSMTAGDPTEGAMALANFNYTYDSGIKYIDENGVARSQPETRQYSIDEWEGEKIVASLSPTMGLNLLNVIPVASATFNTPLNLTASQTAYNQPIINPDGANHFTVAVGTLSVLTDTQITWDADNRRIKIQTGTVTGTETVTVTFTNDNGSTVNGTFTLTVA